MHKIPIDDIPETPFLFSKSQQFLDNIPAKFSDEKKQREYEEYFGGRSLFLSNITSWKLADCLAGWLVRQQLQGASTNILIFEYAYSEVLESYRLFV